MTISHELELTAEEVAFLLGSEPDSRAVTELLGEPTPSGSSEEPADETPERPEKAQLEIGAEPPKRVQRHLTDFGA